ncbi:hypothetical protein KCU71_g15394, partial [Aureobasidium melanogenum]
MVEYQHEGMDGKPFAVYAMATTAASDLESVCQVCDEQVEEEIKQMRPAPVTPEDRFVGKPLREIVAFHRALASEDDAWDKFYFAVVTSDEWKENGVLLVTLWSNDQFQPDAFYVPAVEAGINLINLQIVNTDWMETRCNYESYHQARVSKNKLDDGSDRGVQKTQQDEQQKSRQNQDQTPCFLVYNALYPPQSAHSVLDALDRGWQSRHFKSGERFIEGQIPWERAYKSKEGQIDTVWCTDPWSEALAHHPAQCKQHTQVFWKGKTIDRNLVTRYFVYCNEDFATNGAVSLVEMDWDGVISRNQHEIWEMIYQRTIAVRTESCKAEDAYERLTALCNGSSHINKNKVEYSCDPLLQPDGFLYWI